MKSKILAISLFVFTAGVIGFYPIYQSSRATVVPDPVKPVNNVQAQKIEMVFALDTTGSMSGMINAAKEKIWSIATNMAQAKSAPEIRIGLVGFRDRGDEYVTKVIDLSSDLDTVYAQLMDFHAAGGGDHPESVNQAVYDAVNKISWSKEPGTYKALFLVGDAPPHMDYQNDVNYSDSINKAKAQGIIFNTIQCGRDRNTLSHWKQMAMLSGGAFFNVAQNGNAVAMSTPYDRELATLSEEMDKTRLYYGPKAKMKPKLEKMEATKKLHEKGSIESRARRAAFNSTGSGGLNAIGEGDLVEDVASGKVAAESEPVEHLPAAMKPMSPDERKDYVVKTKQKRDELKAKIDKLAKQRKEYVKQEMKKRGDADDSLDNQLVGTLRAQAKEKGLDYSDKSIEH